MTRAQREEISELLNRAIATAVAETAAIYERPSDMGWWVDTAERAKESRRELWEALYRLPVTDEDAVPRGKPRPVFKLPRPQGPRPLS
jgi:hypothetical protein